MHPALAGAPVDTPLGPAAFSVLPVGLVGVLFFCVLVGGTQLDFSSMAVAIRYRCLGHRHSGERGGSLFLLALDRIGGDHFVCHWMGHAPVGFGPIVSLAGVDVIAVDHAAIAR